MLIAIYFVSLVFIVSLLNTFFNFPAKKLIPWVQSFLQTPPHVTTNPTTSHKEVKTNSSTQDKAELTSVFATFDKNKDGYITKKELIESLKNIGIFMGEKDVADMVEKVDSNGDGLVDLDEFCELIGLIDIGEEMNGKKEGCGKVEDADLKEAFEVFDGDRDGLISVQELGFVLSSLGFKEGKKLEDCKEMIRKIDMDGDGMVNFDEFKRMMKAGRSLVPVS